MKRLSAEGVPTQLQAALQEEEKVIEIVADEPEDAHKQEEHSPLD